MIDGLEAIIAYLLAQSDLTDIVGTRIANRHEYGEAWDVADPGIMVTIDTGVPDLYVTTQAFRLEVRLYGTVPESMALWNILSALGRDAQRVTITTSNGDALIYWFYASSGPSQLVDPDINKPFVMAFFEMAFGEEAV